DEYLSYAYDSGRLGLQKTVTGGALFSLITFYAVKYLTYIGSIVLFAFLLLINLIVFFIRFKKSLTNPPSKVSEEPTQNATPVQPVQPTQPVQPMQPVAPNYNYENGYGYPNQNYQNPNPQYNQPNNYSHGAGYYGGFGVPEQNNNSPYVDAPSKEDAMRILYGNGNRTYSSEYNLSFMEDKVRVGGANAEPSKFNNDNMISSPISKEEINPTYTFEDKSNSYESFDEYDNANTFEEDDSALKYQPSSSAQPSFISDFFKNATKKSEEPSVIEETDSFEEESFEVEEVFEEIPKTIVEPPKPTVTKKAPPIIEKPIVETPVVDNDSATFTSEYSKYLIENMPVKYKYTPPPISLLKNSEKVDNDYQYEIFKAEISNTILETLNNFGVTTEIARVLRGPAISRFDIEVPKNISMDAITKRYKDINLRIATRTPVRMVAPVPGTSYVGIEVANRTKEMVTLKDLVSSKEFLGADNSTLTFTLGKDVVGTPLCIDITQMPHLLIAGATKSGKSVCLNTLIVSLLMKYSPEELRLVIIDPKKVEFKFYEKLPHLYFGEIVNNGDIALTTATLNWVYSEMSRRYSVFTDYKVKNLEGYNKKALANDEKIMPRILVIIDEFANIMLNDKNGANDKICALAAEARAAGIHLILATQRPSADIMEGPIKANLPARIVFKVATDIDSRVCIGKNGAETLLGSGDGLYKTDGMFDYDRFMGAYVSDEEIVDVVDYVKDHNKGYFDYNAWSKIVASVNQSNDISSDASYESSDGGSVDGNDLIDPLNVRAMKIGYDTGGLSTSLLQRKLGVGYPRAAKIIDWLTDNGYITPNSISGKKQMILPREEFEEKFGGGNSSNNGGTQDVEN
ncbi:MAG: DNA translocase FtsK, partial [Clostridia bacterium]|nr:DNA translocase FtsK [Clostridia bacterium]